MKINYINPENLSKPRGYSHAIAVSGSRKTIYIGGQNAIDDNDNIVGKGDIKIQTEQILENIEKILDKAGAKLENVVKFNIHILQGQNPQEGFGVFQQKWGSNPNLPTVTVLFVTGLGNPDWLLEIDAVAEVSE
jgi:enamine deaminase RidA (YjgF/YER057c/UK114 family)